MFLYKLQELVSLNPHFVQEVNYLYIDQLSRIFADKNIKCIGKSFTCLNNNLSNSQNSFHQGFDIILNSDLCSIYGHNVHRNTFTSAKHLYMPVLPPDELMTLLQLNESQYYRIPTTEIFRSTFSNKSKMIESYIELIKDSKKNGQYDNI